MVIRVRKEDSAYLYQLLESYEGLTSFSTLPFETGDPHRDIELHIPPDLQGEVEDLVERMAKEIPLSRLPNS